MFLFSNCAPLRCVPFFCLSAIIDKVQTTHSHRFATVSQSAKAKCENIIKCAFCEMRGEK